MKSVLKIVSVIFCAFLMVTAGSYFQKWHMQESMNLEAYGIDRYPPVYEVLFSMVLFVGSLCVLFYIFRTKDQSDD